MKLSKEQVDLMNHALGAPKYYRNYFCASVGSNDASIWEELVKNNFAIKGALINNGESQYYHVNERGSQLLLAHHKRAVLTHKL